MAGSNPVISSQHVASAFVKQYYAILYKSPENVHKFYQESSLLGWPGSEDAPVTTLDGISAKIMSSDYKNCSVELTNVDSQLSLEGGILVAVTGFSTDNKNIKRKFNQTFFLAKQERVFYVLNDILRLVEISEVLTEPAARTDEIKDVVAPVQNSDRPLATSQNDEVVENGNAKENSYLSVSKGTPEKVAISPKAKREKVATYPKVEKEVFAPLPNVKAEVPKITYASMVARKSPVTSPRIVKVPKQEVAPPSDGPSKVPTPKSTGPKPSTPPTNAAPKVQTGRNSSPKPASEEGKGVYIGRLPYEITKQGIVEVLKQFGPVRKIPDCIQIKRHEDGFCCGFAEFESAEAARRAVETHRVKFGDKEAYILFKKSSGNSGNLNARGSSPPRGGFRNPNFRGRDNGGQVPNNLSVRNENRTSQRKGARRSIEVDRWSNDELQG